MEEKLTYKQKFCIYNLFLYSQSAYLGLEGTITFTGNFLFRNMFPDFHFLLRKNSFGFDMSNRLYWKNALN